MNKISQSEERRLVRAVEHAIELTNNGMNPDEAIQKVASEEKYSPPFVRKMCEAFNVSKARAHGLSKDAEVRTKEYSLANPDFICDKLFSLPQKEAEAVSLPKASLRSIKATDKALQKAAEAGIERVNRYARMAPEAMYDMVQSCRGAHQLLITNFAKEAYSQQSNLRDMINKLGMAMGMMTPEKRTKFCRLVVNGYNETGPQLLKQAAAAANVNVDGMLEKTAATAMFPCEDNYVLVTDIHNTIEKCLFTLNKSAEVQKYASSIIDSLLEGASDMAGSVGGLAHGKKGPAISNYGAEASLDPEFFNALKEVDTRRNFANLMLYDPELSQYNMSQLVDAYNNAVQRVPEASERLPVLKTMMLQHLNSGGISDVFQEAQAAQLSKGLRERTEAAAARLNEQKKMQMEASKLDIEREKAKNMKQKGKSEKGESLLSALLRKGESKDEGGKEPRAEKAKAHEMWANGKNNPYRVAEVVKNLGLPGIASHKDLEPLHDRYVAGGMDSLSPDEQQALGVYFQNVNADNPKTKKG